MKILVLFELTDTQKSRLKAAYPEADILFTSSRAATKEEIESAHIILGNPRSGHLKEAKALRLLQLESAGFERYTAEGVLPKGTILTNATGAYGPAVSEHLLGLWLTLSKKLHLYRDNQNASKWQDRGKVKAIEGAKVLVVGMGDIGSSFAKLAKSLGAYTMGIKRSSVSSAPYFDEVYSLESLEKCLPLADVVVLIVPDSAESHHLMNEARLRLMKKDAILLNGGRGKIIDTQALVKVLGEGHLYAAGLEVTDPEPLPEDHPLWQFENVLITPHVAGGNHLDKTYEKVFEICMENLQALMNEGELKNVIQS